MNPESSFNRGSPRSLGRLTAPGALVAVVLMLAGCGGGDSSTGVSGASAMNEVAANQQTPNGSTQAQNGNQRYVDPIAYSPNAADALPLKKVAEKAAIMHYQWTSGKLAVLLLNKSRAGLKPLWGKALAA